MAENISEEKAVRVFSVFVFSITFIYMKMWQIITQLVFHGRAGFALTQLWLFQQNSHVLSLFSLSTYPSVHVQYIYKIGINLCIRITHTHTHQHAHQPQHGWSDETPHPFPFQQSCWKRSAVRRRKWSCQRRGCEAGCWRFICSGGTAEVAGVKSLHLLTTTA